MTSPGTPRRSVRIDNTVWARIVTAAGRRGVSPSDVIRAAITLWLDYTGADRQ